MAFPAEVAGAEFSDLLVVCAVVTDFPLERPVQLRSLADAARWDRVYKFYFRLRVGSCESPSGSASRSESFKSGWLNTLIRCLPNSRRFGPYLALSDTACLARSRLRLLASRQVSDLLAGPVLAFGRTGLCTRREDQD
ncbi:MAG: hypothetical protein CBC48_13485 [bacterium TMED88]|nr:hypothetical protein [Deltaproteobacteria bacterium]OUV28295.1 MAG: hypothetical protein CBC48_13485 [bacterium TMED88]